MTPLIFYDLAGSPTAPFFSPATTRLRFALLAKGIPFVVKELTYLELRHHWCGLDKPLGVKDATAPFVQKSDGTFLMDSLLITPWLDEAYPDLPSVILPTAPLPIDTTTAEYKAALENVKNFRKVHAETSIQSLLAVMPALEAKLATSDGYFFSATAPNAKDFHVMGVYRMLASTDPEGATRVFSGKIRDWLERMRERFAVGYAEVERRDPVA
ncbi:hypothetical protein P7C70_g558, partial [Phenoliferia sp. Uapishka_3]